ncbi:hypothetical protein SAMN04488130_1121 [Flavobacterium urumqiense]|uniref:Uncharacterized protein n=1 Tax=Flavobacterium urumqiense TaxID=935224 RepID=A0A1H5ZTS0_9FLAO|nr:hypothetical protein SAMN04488130_1121 [Flavobacterium urumqiense]
MNIHEWKFHLLLNDKVDETRNNKIKHDAIAPIAVEILFSSFFTREKIETNSGK